MIDNLCCVIKNSLYIEINRPTVDVIDHAYNKIADEGAGKGEERGPRT